MMVKEEQLVVNTTIILHVKFDMPFWDTLKFRLAGGKSSEKAFKELLVEIMRR